MWTHSSDPNLAATEQRGKWDEKLQTLQWEERDASGKEKITTMKFESEAIMKWTVSYRDANGNATEDRTLHLVATLRK
jgi:hypothetical protein